MVDDNLTSAAGSRAICKTGNLPGIFRYRDCVLAREDPVEILNVRIGPGPVQFIYVAHDAGNGRDTVLQCIIVRGNSSESQSPIWAISTLKKNGLFLNIQVVVMPSQLFASPRINNCWGIGVRQRHVAVLILHKVVNRYLLWTLRSHIF